MLGVDFTLNGPESGAFLLPSTFGLVGVGSPGLRFRQSFAAWGTVGSCCGGAVLPNGCKGKLTCSADPRRTAGHRRCSHLTAEGSVLVIGGSFPPQQCGEVAFPVLAER